MSGVPIRSRGFTLLEVMVAVAILGVGITAILAAQWGAVRTVSEARNLSEANGLARCKMAELEAQLQTEGFVENDFAESGPCCDGEDNPRITCTWQITRPVFPDAKFGELDLDADLDLGAAPGPRGESGGSKSGTGLSAIGALSQANKGGLELPSGGNASDVAQSLTSDMGNVTDGIESMALGIVYPDLRAVFETGTRKVAVRAAWSSGESQYYVDLVEWVTNARVAGLAVPAPTPEEEDEGGSASAGSGGSTKSGDTTKKSTGDMFTPPKGRK